MPFKVNHDRRHHIPRQRHRVTNWTAYEAGLRARGSLTVWFTAEAIEAWRAEPRTTRGGQPRYSRLAIATPLRPRRVAHREAWDEDAARVAQAPPRHRRRHRPDRRLGADRQGRR